MEEPLFDSLKCAAGYINGDLRKTTFRRFLKLVNSDIQNQNDTSAFPCAAVFVATAFRESSEEERKTLSKHITEELSVVPELIGALKTFWKPEGQSVLTRVCPGGGHAGLRQPSATTGLLDHLRQFYALNSPPRPSMAHHGCSATLMVQP